MTVSVLVIIPLVLTLAMFVTREMMLGFPCVIFWAILGGWCYQQSTVTWDIDYFSFFASMGMVIFSLMAMWGLRTRKQEVEEGDTYIDEGTGKGEKFIDEGGKTETEDIESGTESGTRSGEIRARAAARHNRGGHKVRYGEFK